MLTAYPNASVSAAVAEGESGGEEGEEEEEDDDDDWLVPAAPDAAMMDAKNVSQS